MLDEEMALGKMGRAFKGDDFEILDSIPLYCRKCKQSESVFTSRTSWIDVSKFESRSFKKKDQGWK